MTTPKLLPCPACGSDAFYNEITERCICSNMPCMLMGPIREIKNGEKWNDLCERVGEPKSKMPERETWRYRFAGMAMQGLLSAIYSDKEMLDSFTMDETKSAFGRHITGCEAVTTNAIHYADALLRELERGK